MGSHLLRSLVINDFKRNKAINITLFLFLLISALLMATGALVIERLTGSLDQIFDIAQPPHFMQMHVGTLDPEAINEFSASTGMVKSLEIQNMVNIEGVNIAFERQDKTTGSLSDSMMDNYFIAQNRSFDYLLDLHNQIIKVNPNQIGVPVSYARQKNIQVGDTLHITVGDVIMDFSVAYLVRDAQMGSSLASSIRFVVHGEDFKRLKEKALRQEYIIAFRLNQEEDINAFSDLYQQEAANMPKNGVAITLPLIKLVNGIGDGLMSGVIILVSLILIAIAMFNMRFAVLSSLEDEVKEIGTLKAIGLKHSEINGIYKAKYRILTRLACLVAGGLSFFTANLFLDNIALNFGLAKTTMLTYIVPFLAVALMYLIVMLSLNKTLKTLSHMTILDALKEGRLISRKGKNKTKFVSKLKSSIFSTDLTLGLHQYKQNLKPWTLFMVVFFLSTFTILLPLNIYMTMSSPEFTNYVGAAKSDIRMSVEYHPKLQGMVSDIASQLASDPEVSKWHQFKIIKGKIDILVDGQKEKTTFLVEAGDYSLFPVAMTEGYLPAKAGEIALSTLNQNRLGLALKDTLELELGGNPQTFTVVGTYQDITNGGLTAKIASSGLTGKAGSSDPAVNVGLDHQGDIAQYAFFVDVAEGVNKNALADAWGKKYPRAKVIPLDKFIHQTLGTVTDSLGIAVIAVFMLAMVIVGLICVLFMTLRMHKNHSEDAALLAIGFKQGSIRYMYCLQSLISMIIGITLGALASLYLGEFVVGGMLSLMAFGLTQMTFLIQPGYFILLGCMAPLAIGLLLTWQVTGRISKTQLMALSGE